MKKLTVFLWMVFLILYVYAEEHTLRMQSDTFQPKVFQKGKYTLEIGEGKNKKVFTGIKAKSLEKEEVLEIE